MPYSHHKTGSIAILAILLLMTGCSVDKYIESDDLLLWKNTFEVTMADGSKVPPEVKTALTDKNNYLIQQPNHKLLGIGRASMGFYCASDPNKQDWWNNTLRSLGEAPIVYNATAAERSVKQLGGLLDAKGCFHSQVSFDTVKIHNRDITIRYRIAATQRHIIGEVTYQCNDSTIGALLQQWAEDSYLKKGDYYDQDKIVAERSRIATSLLNEGYYRATEELIHFVVDTTYRPFYLSIEVIVNAQVQYPESSERKPLQKYYFNDIRIEKNRVDSNVIKNNLNIERGQQFSPTAITATYNSLSNLHNFNLMNIAYSESKLSTDSLRLLDTRIMLRNTKEQSFDFSLDLTNASPIAKQDSGNFFTNGNIGVGFNVGYQHHNLFRGAELFTIDAGFQVEFTKRVFGREKVNSRDAFSLFEFNIANSIDLPMFLIPFSDYLRDITTRPHTVVTLGTNYQYRTDLSRLTLNASFGYTWSTSRKSRHTLTPIEIAITYVDTLGSDILRSIGGNAFRQYFYYTSHEILGGHYSYTYSDEQPKTRNDYTFFRGTIESSGALLGLISTLIGKPRSEYMLGQYPGLFNIPYEQYLKFTAECKHYFYHSDVCALVLRGMAGVALPYGNNNTLPYDHSYFIGGTSTLRAWPFRGIGPGSTPNSETTQMLGRWGGDIMLLFNIEERFPIVGPIEGAVFADMGNTWLARRDSEFSTIYPNGHFTWDNFVNDIALGIGIGLRLKISVLTLRFDFAIPAYDPNATDTKWRFSKWQFNQIATNFGLDYPF